ncbi:VOC family protein [Allosphingosinicella humi]
MSALAGTATATARSPPMLKNHSSSAIVAVRDIDRARAFYGDVLGLELLDDSMEGVLTYRTGETRLIVYRSDEAGTNRANAVVWGVGDELDAIVAALEGKGVQFEQYPHIGRLEGNIHIVGDARLAWLKDPDGNILHINSM